MHPTCPECGRKFDLTNEDDAEEFAYGHDTTAKDDTMTTSRTTLRNAKAILLKAGWSPDDELCDAADELMFEVFIDNCGDEDDPYELAFDLATQVDGDWDDL